MADDPSKDDPATSDPSTDANADPAKADDLPEGARKALDAARAEAKEAKRRATVAEKAAKDAADALKAAQDAGKTDTERLEQRVAQLEGSATAAEKRALRAEVASEKGLPPKLAARLQGDTREELEADADELLEFATADNTREAGAGSFRGGQRGGSGGIGGKPLPEGNAEMNQRLRDLLSN